MLSLRTDPAAVLRLFTIAGWQISIVALALLTGSPSAAARDYVDAINKLNPGLTEAQVLELLGPPNSKLPAQDSGLEGEAWYYRLSTLADRQHGVFTSSTPLTDAGRVRCEFKGGLLLRVAGIWPRPSRPTTAVPKNKILLVDVIKLYDGLESTHRFTAHLRKLEAERQLELDALNAAGNSLVEQYAKARDAWKQFKGSKAEKLEMENRASSLNAEIQKKKREVDQFQATARLGLRNLVDRYQDALLPAISDAILKFKTERGYEYAYEINQSILSPGTKPVFVSGVDETYEIVKWIDAGHAKGAGL